MDIGGAIAVFGILIWCVLKEIRDNLIALRLQSDPTFHNIGLIKYRCTEDGAVETITTKGFRRYKSKNEFESKTGYSIQNQAH